MFGYGLKCMICERDDIKLNSNSVCGECIELLDEVLVPYEYNESDKTPNDVQREFEEDYDEE